MDNAPYARPPTPQALLHRVPNKPDSSDDNFAIPKKYIILLLAPVSVAGKVQIATLVSKYLSCPLYSGDSLHESSAKAAAVGASRSNDSGRGRYQRMWLSKMTRTGLLFPDESRPATEGFSGFGGSSSTSTSRRGSGSSISSMASFRDVNNVGSIASSTVDVGNPFLISAGILGSNQYINQPSFTLPKEEILRKMNPALMVLTHPELEPWHKHAIRQAIGEYGIGIIFVPLYKNDAKQENDEEKEKEEKLPLLLPLDRGTVSRFSSFDAFGAAAACADDGKNLKYGNGKKGNLKEEMVLDVNIEGNVDDIVEEVVRRVKDVMFT
jgi:hypothetical protein